jgi:hypothetical protein
MDTRIRGYDSHLVMPESIGHLSLILSCPTRSGIHGFKGMDTRIRGHDSHLVMPDLIGHPQFFRHGYPHSRV